jgi:hypothetical protein
MQDQANTHELEPCQRQVEVSSSLPSRNVRFSCSGGALALRACPQRSVPVCGSWQRPVMRRWRGWCSGRRRYISQLTVRFLTATSRAKCGVLASGGERADGLTTSEDRSAVGSSPRAHRPGIVGLLLRVRERSVLDRLRGSAGVHPVARRAHPRSHVRCGRRRVRGRRGWQVFGRNVRERHWPPACRSRHHHGHPCRCVDHHGREEDLRMPRGTARLVRVARRMSGRRRRAARRHGRRRVTRTTADGEVALSMNLAALLGVIRVS